ncbi:MAG: prolyl oligopeptidase family serine peptidase [Clostridia bacterium]|nr:prolyl oligopeptidase family serine peptidase [Clostridia bacterium]MBQ8716835.1 prolyl oligopeptidase family serine peptidase [Clostridia bacterium]
MELTLDGLRYLIRYPKDYKEGERYPVLFFFHGAGTRGKDMNKLLSNPFFTHIEAHEDFPFIVVAPLCTENTWFDLFERLEKLVKETVAADFADSSRVYAIGASMGGYATWQLGMSLPEIFAAIVPICGGGMYWNAPRLKSVPVWAFHGEKDHVVSVEETKKMVAALTRAGGDIKMTLYPENKHDAWSDTYKNPAVFAWMLSHQKGSASAEKDAFSDSKIYG